LEAFGGPWQNHISMRQEKAEALSAAGDSNWIVVDLWQLFLQSTIRYWKKGFPPAR
jgi:hypothetical protein